LAAFVSPSAPVTKVKSERARGAGERARPPRRLVVVLGVSGSIAAYKAVEVARLLVKAGARVVPVMTPSAQRFLGAATLAGITGERVHTDMFDPAVAGELHVELGAAADVVALVPATAELCAALAQGRADDLVRATALCARGTVVVAPAMHPRMWLHPATRRNVAAIVADGRAHLVGPLEGEVASGDVGPGRMAEPDVIAAAVLERALAARDLDGLRVVVSAGPTVEDIDPARFVSNRSSGKMGYAIAERAAARGAEVVLVSGPVSLAPPPGCTRVSVRSAGDMRAALWNAMGERLDRADALVMAAAVADFRPRAALSHKLKRSANGAGPRLELVPNPDLLAEIAAARRKRGGARPYLVGFALETLAGEALVAAARGKLRDKQVDMVVANDAGTAFEGEDNAATLVTARDVEPLPLQPKRLLADRILDRVVASCRK
jgi:phosphopantothenoylcysteine decarboxylase/phosphopantothenate--cysteine ligase